MPIISLIKVYLDTRAMTHKPQSKGRIMWVNIHTDDTQSYTWFSMSRFAAFLLPTYTFPEELAHRPMQIYPFAANGLYLLPPANFYTSQSGMINIFVMSILVWLE